MWDVRRGRGGERRETGRGRGQEEEGRKRQQKQKQVKEDNPPKVEDAPLIRTPT